MSTYVNEVPQGTLSPGETGRATLWTADVANPVIAGRQFTEGATSTFRVSFKEVSVPNGFPSRLKGI